MNRQRWKRTFSIAVCVLTLLSGERTTAHPQIDRDTQAESQTNSLRWKNESDRARVDHLTSRMERAAEFILKQQDEHGAMNESGYINTDSNMLYAIMGLLAAYDQTKRPQYLAAAEQGCRWLMKLQNPEGDWFLSYRREKDRYVPALPKSYSQFSAIRGVDTTMALFIHAANQLRQRTSNQKLSLELQQAAKRAYHFLLANNLDQWDGLFWSSYQLETKEENTPSSPLSAYRLFPVKYAADNAETYLGVLAAAEMFHDQGAGMLAQRLKASFSRFFDAKKGCYAVMLDKEGKTRMSPSYARYFATGWSAYLLRDQVMFACPRSIIAEEMKANGSFSRWEGTYTLSTLSFLLGECREMVRSPKIKQAEAFLFSQQMDNGGIADDPKSKNTYVNLAGLFLLYLSEELKS